jgi:hypothetical protein
VAFLPDTKTWNTLTYIASGVYGWNKAFIISLLIGSVALLCIFTWVEKRAENPIMPLGLWKLPNFAGLWIAGFGKHLSTIGEHRR